MDVAYYAVFNEHIIIGGGTPTGQPGEAAVGTGTATQQPPAQAEQPPGMGWSWLLIWGGVILLMYLLMFRPQRKREKKMKEMQAAISTGDNVVTNAGLFGKVADVGEDCFVIEFGTNRGIRIPVLKSEVIGIRTPQMNPQPKD
jgi:preprotein translocase subunit YajC